MDSTATTLTELGPDRVSYRALSSHDFDGAVTDVQPRNARTATTTCFVVRVASGADVGQSVEATPAMPSALLVGQGPFCDLRLRDRHASRRHLSLDVVDGALRVRDLGSTNGTRINGLSVAQAFLQGGERIMLGETTLEVFRIGRSRSQIPQATGFGKLVGASEAMRKLYPLCERLAGADVPVVIEGETGTGKEVLAESLHERGPRRDGPFTVFDCTAVPPNLLESALFGHERGSFTGATETRAGVFEEAHGGTLLIDEIGDLDVELQAKLLRALERGEVRRVGGKKWIKVSVRVLAATRRDLDLAVEEGRFRDDLFYRLAVARIELPPLRERHGDVALLARHFHRLMARGAEPPDDLIATLEGYPFPGNVRELHNTIARRVALGDLADAQSQRRRPSPRGDSGDAVARILAEELPFPQARQKMLAEFDQRYVEQVLARHDGNVTKAAAASGIALRYFQMVRARAKRDAG